MVSITCAKYTKHYYFRDLCIACKCFEAAVSLFRDSGVTCQLQFGASFISVVRKQQSHLQTVTHLPLVRHICVAESGQCWLR